MITLVNRWPFASLWPADDTTTPGATLKFVKEVAYPVFMNPLPGTLGVSLSNVMVPPSYQVALMTTGCAPISAYHVPLISNSI